jgi:hypothetical protein
MYYPSIGPVILSTSKIKHMSGDEQKYGAVAFLLIFTDGFEAG